MTEFRELENCKLCSWECGVNRLSGEIGVCMMGLPEVASCQLHPAPPQSYTIFTVGCNYRCLNCQNWYIAHYPMTKARISGSIEPDIVAIEGINEMNSRMGQLINADRFFFSGGAPVVSLPWIEKVVEEARKIDPKVKVNFDTNGFPTEESFQRILAFTDSITFDIKAFNDETHRALTGAPVEPVLRNAEEMIKNKEKLWEFRILVIPSIVDQMEIQAISEFIASYDESIPISFLTFRPNFCLDNHPGATRKLMEEAVTIAKKEGLENAKWAGHPNISGNILNLPDNFRNQFANENAALASYYAKERGCCQIIRECGNCSSQLNCKLKSYTPFRTC
ncbi:MAG: radical SAM protein [Asgard group archaeon]|nr:radical SAM protein [Asgard group archaeon]